MKNGKWLCSDWDHRDPRDDLHNVDDGLYLSALQRLPGSIRLLLQDSEMHVEIEEVDGVPLVTKIIKRREPEYLKGHENFFIFDDEGKRIPLSEEEYNELLGFKKDSEDVLNMEGDDLQSLDSEWTPPMDVHDVIYDATEYVHTVQRLVESEPFQKQSNQRKIEIIKKLQNDLIYSADYFPYPKDKRFHTEASKKVAKLIFDEDLTKQQLGAMLGPRCPDKRAEYVKELRARASKMMPGVDKARTLKKAQKVYDSLIRDRKAGRSAESSIFSDSDRAKLWALWRAKEAKNKGSVKLLSWQFKKLFSSKLQRTVVIPEMERIDNALASGKVTRDQAKEMQKACITSVNEKLRERVNALYGEKAQRIEQLKRDKVRALELPTWLTEAPLIEEPPAELTDEDIAFDLDSGPPDIEEVLDDQFFGPETVFDQEGMSQELLEGGSDT